MPESEKSQKAGMEKWQEELENLARAVSYAFSVNFPPPNYSPDYYLLLLDKMSSPKLYVRSWKGEMEMSIDIKKYRERAGFSYESNLEIEKGNKVGYSLNIEDVLKITNIPDWMRVTLNLINTSSLKGIPEIRLGDVTDMKSRVLIRNEYYEDVSDKKEINTSLNGTAYTFKTDINTSKGDILLEHEVLWTGVKTDHIVKGKNIILEYRKKDAKTSKPKILKSFILEDKNLIKQYYSFFESIFHISVGVPPNQKISVNGKTLDLTGYVDDMLLSYIDKLDTESIKEGLSYTGKVTDARAREDFLSERLRYIEGGKKSVPSGKDDEVIQVPVEGILERLIEVRKGGFIKSSERLKDLLESAEDTRKKIKKELSSISDSKNRGDQSMPPFYHHIA